MKMDFPELCNTHGAFKLKAKIEAYWAERGAKVNVKIVDAEFTPQLRSARADVRSDMVNGMPKGMMHNG